MLPTKVKGFGSNLISSFICGGCTNFCDALFCSRCMLARQYNFLKYHNFNRNISWWYFCSGCIIDGCCLYSLPIALTYQTLEVRSMIRRRFHVLNFRVADGSLGSEGLPAGTGLQDLAVVSFCQSCATAQQELELSSRSEKYGRGKGGGQHPSSRATSMS